VVPFPIRSDPSPIQPLCAVGLFRCQYNVPWRLQTTSLTRNVYPTGANVAPKSPARYERLSPPSKPPPGGFPSGVVGTPAARGPKVSAFSRRPQAAGGTFNVRDQRSGTSSFLAVGGVPSASLYSPPDTNACPRAKIANCATVTSMRPKNPNLPR